MQISLNYDLIRKALLAASLAMALLSLFGAHPVFAGDGLGNGPH